MDEQGAGRGQEDEWWRRLYGEGSGGGTGPSPSDAADTLDDRVDSALRTVGPPRPRRPDPAPESLTPPQPPPPPADGPAAPAQDTPSPPRPARPSVPGRHLLSPGQEPVALPAADPASLDAPVPDTELDGAAYGSFTLRAASLRGDLARYHGEPRRDALLTARFGTGRDTLVLVAVATGPPGAEGCPHAARAACTGIGGAVGRSCTRLAEDLRTDRRDALRSGLQRLTERSWGKLRGRATERGTAPEEDPAAVRCLLLPADPECRTRVFFGVGGGGLFRLRDGGWQDLEPATAAGRPFLFRPATARAGDTLLLCSTGLAEPLRDNAAYAARLADRWGTAPPGLVAFLSAAQWGVQGHAKDRTAVGVWES
ncbi:protein phosphatase 2C domain-containing protein [Streptomyces sp. NPDC048483]|uniref:protein phosphatase 2C domain-containing protein n=1 Tax=Streptomyces sp. NPDC048483 TaxID=3154927 RepID=UPI00343FCFEA